MAYQENSASSPADAIDKIGAFAASAGWTVIQNTLSGSIRTLVLKRATSDYIQVWNDATNIWITAYIGYVAGTARTAQVGYAGSDAQANVGLGPYTKLYLFADSAPSPHVHVVVEMANGIFRHLTFGELTKLGTWTGGTFFDATYWAESWNTGYAWLINCMPMFAWRGWNSTRNGALRVDIPDDGRANAWAVLDENFAFSCRTGLYDSTSNSATGHGFLVTQVYNRNDAPFSGQVTLGTIRAEITRPGGFRSVAGTFPNVRYLSMKRYSPGQEITVAADTWKVFPMCRKGAGQNINDPQYWPFSNDHAYAFKKVL